MAEFHIFVVSDGTGETATRMSKAALLQFRPASTSITRFNNIRSVGAIRDIVKEAESRHALVVHTFATQELRRAMEDLCQTRNIPNHDLIGRLFSELEQFIGTSPTQKPGLLHQVDDEYFERLDALSFTLRHDDVREPEDLDQAEIILVGLSRTSKTPLSIYLAQEGWRVANIPLVQGEALPRSLERADPARVVAVTISPERLIEIRSARASRLGAGGSDYADPGSVRKELEFARGVFNDHPRWLVLDVTGKSVEEVAAEILDRLFGRERRLKS
jgi:regulator of PEP synthase PpsR (kinase-PPPase family)